MLIIPLSAVPSQTLNIVLANQNCTINVYKKTTGIYFDLLVDGLSIVQCVICQNINKLINKLHTEFVGDFTFYDTQGLENPDYTGFGTRFFLVYLETSDLL